MVQWRLSFVEGAVGNNQIAAYIRNAWALRAFLREPATAEGGRERIRRSLAGRGESLLRVIKNEVFDNPSSPWLALLQFAGCEYADIERMVRADGVEPTLRRLYESGVYLTNEEFKGRKPAVRGGRTFAFHPEQLNSRFVKGSLQTSTSGSRGSPVSTTMRLDRVAYVSFCHAEVFAAHRLEGRPTLLWMPILPSGAGLTHLLQLCKMRVPPERWFSPVAASRIKPSLSKRFATLYIVHAGRLFGARIPAPEYVSGEQVHVVAECLRDILRRGRGCVVACSPSSAVRACHASRAAGIDLTGALFVTGGEPLTPAKAAEIERAGAKAMNLYAFSEGGIVGFGCAGEKQDCDDIHVQQGSLAVIQHVREAPFGGGPVNAFLLTSLMERPAKVLINVENGDYGVLETRQCGCELGALGLTQHLHTIRSFDKLTGEGMTFIGTDFVRVIEEVLPSRFGGASTDYQMVEVEDADGRTRLDVLVSPEVGDVDDAEVSRIVLAELARGGDTRRMMAEAWRQGQVLRVRRERPHLTAGGKLLSLHIMKDADR